MSLHTFEQRLAVYTCEGPAELSAGEPVLLSGESAVLPFAQFHDRSGIFTIEEQSPVLTRVAVTTSCLQAFSSFSPYFPIEERYLPLAQSNADVEALGEIEFSPDVPAVYVVMRKDGTFEMGTHSDTRIDNSSHPDHYKAQGKLFASGGLIVAKGEARDSSESKDFYFTAIIDSRGGVEIFGAQRIKQ